MSTSAEELRVLVEEVVSPLVDVPSELEVTASQEGSDVLIEVAVNPDDAGKVIGRQGRVIKSIRTLVRAAATRKGLNVDVELLDD